MPKRAWDDERERIGREIVAIANRIRGMTHRQRLEMASRTDLSENEQLALAAFADDGEIADALRANLSLTYSAEGILSGMDPVHRRLYRWVRKRLARHGA
jgi:hypothetical protein